MPLKQPNPLVSIMMPCYNSANTLPLALASLLAQTYTNWECIVVDDGSNDNPEEIVKKLNDPRIKFIRLEKNVGRGTARQIALDNTQGDYLCMLDADDWYFPDKIQRQIDIMESIPNLVLVSTGMAIADANHNLVGVRGGRNFYKNSSSSIVINKFSILAPPSIAFAPSMIRCQIAKQAGFDLSLIRAEDADFLITLMLQRHYAVLQDITYTYNEMYASSEEILLGYNSAVRVFKKRLRNYPITAGLNVCSAMLRGLIYRVALSIGFGSSL